MAGGSPGSDCSKIVCLKPQSFVFTLPFLNIILNGELVGAFRQSFVTSDTVRLAVPSLYDKLS